MTATDDNRRTKSMSMVHALVVGAAALAFLFVLCWASEALGLVPATHGFVSLFAQGAQTSSVSALASGLPAALALGALAGAAIAFFANTFRFLDRR